VSRTQLEEARRRAGAGALAGLVAKLRGLDRVTWRGDLSAGRPDPRRIAQLAADLCTTGCRQRRMAPAPRIAIACLIDTSSSMSMASVIGSEGCALALCEAVRRCGGTASVGAFCHYLLAPDEPIQSARLAHPDGGTPMSAGIGGAMAALASPEARRCHIRLMVVLSDGMPGDPDETLALARRARAAGIQLLGVFLQPPRAGQVTRDAQGHPLDPQQAARRVASRRVAARALWPVASERAGWSQDPARQAQVEVLAQKMFPLDGVDPFEGGRLDALASQQSAARLSAALGGVPACCIHQAEDLARAAVPALRALVTRWTGERV
jgi:Mg-chelatase subunit ChlD